MFWGFANKFFDAVMRTPHVALCFLGCGLTRGWLDILILEARATPTGSAWLPAGVHVIMALAEAACFLLLGLSARRLSNLRTSALGAMCFLTSPLVGATLITTSPFTGSFESSVRTLGLVLCGIGYAAQLLLWLEAFGLLNTKLAVLAWAESHLVSFCIWAIVVHSDSTVSRVFLFLLPIASIASAVTSYRHIQSGSEEAERRSARDASSTSGRPLDIPWLLIVWVCTFGLLYGIADGVTGMAFSTAPSRFGMAIPSVIVLVGVIFAAGRFDFKAMTIIAVIGMVVGLVIVFVLQASPAASQLFISAANESYLMFAHMFACSLAHRTDHSAAGPCGLVGATNIVAIQLGMVAGKALQTSLEQIAWLSIAVGCAGIILAIALTVAAVYNRDYLDSFTLRPNPDDRRRTLLAEKAVKLALSPKEIAVFNLLADGMPAPEIAEELFLAPSTVRAHTSNIYRKMGIHTRAEFETLISTKLLEE